MVSGLKKNNSRTKNNGKGGAVFAKNKAQAVLAAIVLCVFAVVSTRTISQYIQEQNPEKVDLTKQAITVTEDTQPETPATDTSSTTATTPTTNQSMVSPGSGSPVGSPIPGSTVNTQPPGSTLNNASSPTVPPPESGIPILPIVLIIAAIVGGIIYARSKNTVKGSSHTPGAKKGNKKAPYAQRSNQGLILAKDQGQLYLAAGVLVLFLISTVFTIIRYYQEENPAPVVATNSATPEENNTLMANNPMSPKDPAVEQDANNIYSQTLNLQTNQQNVNITPTDNLPKDEIEIIPKKTLHQKFEKKVSIIVDNSGRQDPFLPIGNSIAVKGANSLPFLTAPPETLPTNSEAGKVMSTTISGILYDKYSPSAIINIEGADYLVKRGDVINHYKILSIGKTQVIVQLGKNVYQAGVGELLSPTDISYNTIANLNKKFGGNDVSINIRRK